MAIINQDGAAITFHKDVLFTIQGAGADDGNKILSGGGARTLATDSVTFKANEVEISYDPNNQNHAQGQSTVRHMRGTQTAQSIRVRRNMEIDDAVAKLLSANSVVVFSATGLDSAGASDGTRIPEPFEITQALAKVGPVSGTFAAPGTMEFTLEDYGLVWL